MSINIIFQEFWQVFFILPSPLYMNVKCSFLEWNINWLFSWKWENEHIVKFLHWWSLTGTDSPGKWSWHQDCQSSRSIMWFSFRLSCEKQGVRPHDSYDSLPTWDTLWFSELANAYTWASEKYSLRGLLTAHLTALHTANQPIYLSSLITWKHEKKQRNNSIQC